MMKTLAGLLLLIASTGASAETFENIEFGDSGSAKVIADSSVEVTLQSIPEDEYSAKAIAAVRYPGFPPMLIELETTPTGYSRGVGIGKLSASDQAPSAIFQSFSGGAHCCSTIVAAVPVGGRYRKVEIGTWAGEGISAFPRDVDGDGNADFVMNDGAFNYAFSSYAGSWAPPQVKNVYRGQVVDVSAQPEFRSLFEEFSKKARVACSDRSNPDRNGACAGYVASEARLGNVEAALKFADMMSYKGGDVILPSKCKVAYVDYVCPQGQEITFGSFYSAIRWFLNEHGYTQ